MILTEAKKRAQREFDETLARTRLTVDEVRAYVDAHPELKKATYRVPHDGTVAGTRGQARPGRRQSNGPRRCGGRGDAKGGIGRALPHQADRRRRRSTTVKAVVVEDGKVGWQDYQRHNTRQAEKVVEFLGRMEAEAGVTPAATASSSPARRGFLAPLVGGKLIQEVVAVAACVERLHPDVRFVSEIGART